MTNETLNYYNQNAQQFAAGTVNADFKTTQDRFLERLGAEGCILDFGCGAGRDSKYFLEKGYEVEATDGSEELCKLASDYTGLQVKKLLFSELDETERYDGIWACASILHLEKRELAKVMRLMARALKENGIIYTSFKHSEFEGLRNGRYFTDFTSESFEEFMKDISELQTEEHWITGDVRPGREEEQWLNLILKKTNF
ncbi:MAG: class I SAM-dependent methyltransferase [Bacteroidaceae bacterium]|nr:class I SAM-dependent methyltransferase [Bacteroidaceae bacterium]